MSFHLRIVFPYAQRRDMIAPAKPCRAVSRKKQSSTHRMNSSNQGRSRLHASKCESVDRAEQQVLYASKSCVLHFSGSFNSNVTTTGGLRVASLSVFGSRCCRRVETMKLRWRLSGSRHKQTWHCYLRLLTLALSLALTSVQTSLLQPRAVWPPLFTFAYWGSL